MQKYFLTIATLFISITAASCQPSPNSTLDTDQDSQIEKNNPGPTDNPEENNPEVATVDPDENNYWEVKPEGTAVFNTDTLEWENTFYGKFFLLNSSGLKELHEINAGHLCFETWMIDQWTISEGDPNQDTTVRLLYSSNNAKEYSVTLTKTSKTAFEKKTDYCENGNFWDGTYSSNPQSSTPDYYFKIKVPETTYYSWDIDNNCYTVSPLNSYWLTAAAFDYKANGDTTTLLLYLQGNWYFKDDIGNVQIHTFSGTAEKGQSIGITPICN